MLERREPADEWPPEKNAERKSAGRKSTARVKDVQVEPSMAADFTVSIFIILICHPNNLNTWGFLGCCKQREETSHKCPTYI
jgi:hypothetical protein